MVKLTKIYTRGGDGGQTSLGGGARVPKHDLRVTAYGTVDEANAAIGCARLHTRTDDQAVADAMLARLQNDFFDLGADLCTPLPAEGTEEPGSALRISVGQVERLEAEIDQINDRLSPLNSFVLPGGSPASAHLHLARTITRRAERLICQLAESEPVNPQAVAYANRASDLLFVLGRHLNGDGAGDVLWKAGQNL